MSIFEKNSKLVGTGNSSPKVMGRAAACAEDKFYSHYQIPLTVMGLLGVVLLLAAPAAMTVSYEAFEKDHVSDPFMQWLSFEHGYYSLVQLGLILAIMGICCIWMAWFRDKAIPCIMLFGAPAAYYYCHEAVGFERNVRSMGELFHWMAGYAIILHAGIVLTVCGIVMLLAKAMIVRYNQEHEKGIHGNNT